jgi:hypothetical protein
VLHRSPPVELSVLASVYFLFFIITCGYSNFSLSAKIFRAAANTLFDGDSIQQKAVEKSCVPRWFFNHARINGAVADQGSEYIRGSACASAFQAMDIESHGRGASTTWSTGAGHRMWQGVLVRESASLFFQRNKETNFIIKPIKSQSRIVRINTYSISFDTVKQYRGRVTAVPLTKHEKGLKTDLF